MRARSDWVWLALLCLLPTLLPASGQAWLEYRREAVLAGEVWRLWSGHFVHYSMSHALQDGLVAVILALALDQAGAGSHLLLRLALIAPLLSLMLVLAVPSMAFYRGASGLDMALAGMLLRLLWSDHPAWRPGLLGIAMVLCGKMLADALGMGFALTLLPEGVRVAWQVHGAGLVLGWLAEHLASSTRGHVSTPA